MGLWVRSPRLLPSEKVQWKKSANRTQGGRAVGGRLYLTRHRLLFEPNRVDAVTKGQPWATDLRGIGHVGTEMPDGDFFSGGLRTRLRLDMENGTAEFFVVNDLETVVRTLQQAVESAD